MLRYNIGQRHDLSFSELISSCLKYRTILVLKSYRCAMMEQSILFLFFARHKFLMFPKARSFQFFMRKLWLLFWQGKKMCFSIVEASILLCNLDCCQWRLLSKQTILRWQHSLKKTSWKSIFKWERSGRKKNGKKHVNILKQNNQILTINDDFFSWLA
jgi:hypothetical protein